MVLFDKVNISPYMLNNEIRRRKAMWAEKKKRGEGRDQEAKKREGSGSDFNDFSYAFDN